MRYFIPFLCALCLLSSCNRDRLSTNINNDKYNSIMLDEYEKLCDDFSNIINAFSKSSGNSNVEITESCEYTLEDVPKWMLPYLEKYWHSDNVYDWDETAVLDDISHAHLTDTQKECIAKTLAYGYYAKNELLKNFQVIFTKGLTEEDCLKAFKEATSRAIRNFVVSGAVGVVSVAADSIVSAVSSVITAIIAYDDIDAAEKAYNDCMEKVNEGN